MLIVRESQSKEKLNCWMEWGQNLVSFTLLEDKNNNVLENTAEFS